MRTVLLAAALVALAGSALAEERVLYCTETGSAGFVWLEGQTEGQRAEFGLARYVVKVLSETKRTVRLNTVDIAENTKTLTCRKPFDFSVPDLLTCNDSDGLSPWLFRGNTFVLADLLGPPVGGRDRDILVSYGTCTGF